MKLQAPSCKLQRRSKLQTLGWATAPGRFGTCDLELLWSLELGAWSFFSRASLIAAMLLFSSSFLAMGSASADGSFIAGRQAYQAADYEKAANAFRQSAALHPASGTLQNLGLAEWQRANESRNAFNTLYRQTLWDQAQQDPAYKAYAERELKASGFSLRELKQRWDINQANNRSAESIASGHNKNALQIANINAEQERQKTALQAAQVAAELSSKPADYFQAANFYQNANKMSAVPSWLTGMINGQPQFAYVPPGTGASGIVGQQPTPAMVAGSPTTPNADLNGNTVMAPAVAGDTSGGTTGTGTPAPIAGIAGAPQTVASTAPVNGTPALTLDPNGSQAGSLAYTSALLNGQAVPQGMQSLGTIDQIARNPNKIAPGTLEGLSSTQRDLLYSGLGRQGYDVPSFLKSYGAYSIGQDTPNRYVMGQNY